LGHTLILRRLISGGEVSLTEVEARSNGHSVTVWGNGVAEFPHEPCGRVEVTLLNEGGEILEQKAAEYDTSAWYHESPRRTSDENRSVSFSVNIPYRLPSLLFRCVINQPAVANILGSLQPVVNWLLGKMSFGKKPSLEQLLCTKRS
jgi:hypothetical protein